jgi:ribose/xylose/arabinose/galactoside ABC-type transport system permease subunit
MPDVTPQEGLPSSRAARRSTGFSVWNRYSTELTLAAILLAFVVVLSVATPYFLTEDNLSNLVKQSAINGIIALGVTAVIITGGIDLSVGAVAGLTGVVTASLMVGGVPTLASCAGGLVAAAGVGVLNAVMIYEGRIPPFIATLATMTMGRGLIKLVTDARMITGLPNGFLHFGEANYLGIPSQFWVWMVLAASLSVVLTRMRAGRNFYAIGASAEVARLSGINLRRSFYLVYVLGALMAGIAGLVLTARVRMASPTAGTGYELYAIAAAVIGGASLNGAQGSVPGAILGALIMTTITNGGNLLGIDAFTLEIVIGALIAGAVWLDKLRTRNVR